LKSEDGQEVTDISYIKIDGAWKLVLTFNTGCKIWTEDGKRLLTYLRVPETHLKFYKDQSIQNSFQGITGAKTKNEKQLICVGNSLGEVYFFENTKESLYNNFVGFTLKNEAAITKLASSQKYNLLFIGDIQGFLYIYLLESLKDVKFLKTIDLNNQNNPITALGVYENENACYLFSGDMLGKVRIFDAMNYNLVIEIAAHFRLITSLDISSKLNRFITTSEDTFLNVWKINSENGFTLTLAKSYNSNDKMILGGKILEKEKFNVMITQYDCHEVSVLTSLS
jgi:WD40 repeat protein